MRRLESIYLAVRSPLPSGEPPDARQVVFSLAVDFVLADGTVEDEEKELIGYLQSKLRVTDDQASTIVNVLALKNGA